MMRYLGALSIICFGMSLIHGKSECRDMLAQPFSSSSIWNTPIGDQAVFVHANLEKEVTTTIFHEDSTYFASYADKGDWEEAVWIQQGWWGPPPPEASKVCPEPNENNTWCHCVQIGKPIQNLSIPYDFVTNSAGNSGFGLQINETFAIQMQPLYRCEPGSPVLALYIGNEEVRVTDLRGEGTYGAHGGTSLSAIGGMIRKGELNETAPEIQHAIQIELYAWRYYYCDRTNISTCFRWPALHCDGYATNCSGGEFNCYNGTNPALRTGALLAIPSASWSVCDTLQTVVAKKICKALSYFGGYIVDDASGTPEHGRTNICYERGVEEEVLENYGLVLSTTGGPLFEDFVSVFKELQIVDNNSPTSIGGGGNPVHPPPPPLCPLE